MSFIVRRNADTRMVLQDSNIARLHGITSAWQTIRVGIRYIMGLDATFMNNFSTTEWFIQSLPTFAIGFCSGNGHGHLYMDATTTHFVGVVGTSDWTFQNVGSNITPQYQYKFSTNAAVKVGSTVTYDNSSTGTWGIGASGAEAGVGMFLVDLVKGSPNYTINAFSHVGNNAAWTQPTLADLEQQMELVNPGFSFYTTTSGSVIVNEAVNGTLDNVTVAWGRTPQTLEICDLIVARVA